MSEVPGSPKPELWARHSYRLNTLTPFLSDLDISVWFEAEPNLEQISALDRIFDRIARIVPLARDVNIYSRAEAGFVSRWINPFELDRDPDLSERLDASCGRERSDDLRTVFLLRMLESDAHNLIERPRDRLRKWDQHLKVLKPRPSLSWSADEYPGSRVRELLKLILKDRDNRLIEPALEYLKISPSRRAAGEGCHEETLIGIFPQRFTRSNLDVNAAAFHPGIFIAQLEWELWGLGTQFRNSKVNSSFEWHLRNISDLLDRHRDFLGGSDALPELKAAALVLSDRVRDFRKADKRRPTLA